MTDQIHNYEGQPARKIQGQLEVYLGAGWWKPIDDPSAGFGYASPMDDEEAAELIAEWDANPIPKTKPAK